MKYKCLREGCGGFEEQDGPSWAHFNEVGLCPTCRADAAQKCAEFNQKLWSRHAASELSSGSDCGAVNRVEMEREGPLYVIQAKTWNGVSGCEARHGYEKRVLQGEDARELEKLADAALAAIEAAWQGQNVLPGEDIAGHQIIWWQENMVPVLSRPNGPWGNRREELMPVAKIAHRHDAGLLPAVYPGGLREVVVWGYKKEEGPFIIPPPEGRQPS